MTDREADFCDYAGIFLLKDAEGFHLVRKRDRAVLAGPLESQDAALDFIAQIQAQEPRLAEARLHGFIDRWVDGQGWFIAQIRR